MKKRSWLGGVLLIAIVLGACAAWFIAQHDRSTVAHDGESAQPTLVAQPTQPTAVNADQSIASSSARAGGRSNVQDTRSAPNTSAAGAILDPTQALDEIKGLVGRGKIGAARDLAEAYLQRIPDGPEAAQIKALTGVHPHP